METWLRVPVHNRGLLGWTQNQHWGCVSLLVALCKTGEKKMIYFVTNLLRNVMVYLNEHLLPYLTSDYGLKQGGRTWQAFGGGKKGHETFRQVRNYNFRDKCVKFSNLIQ